MDFIIIQGDTLAIGGTAAFDDVEDMTGWTAEVKLRKQPGPTGLGDEALTLAFQWEDVTTGDWTAETQPGDTLNLTLGIYLLYMTLIDAAGRRFTPTPYQVMVSA